MKSYNSALWLIAIAFFFVGDLVTTIVGISHPLITESTPYLHAILIEYGIWFMLFVLIIGKVIALLLLYGAWERMNGFHRVAIPSTILLLGIYATAWNTFLIMVNTL